MGNWKDFWRKTIFRADITTEICHQSGCQAIPRGRAYDSTTATIEIPVFFLLQIKHKVYLSLVRRLEGHSSQSISGSIRRKNRKFQTNCSEVSQTQSLHACWTRMLYHDRLNSQSTNSAKTLKIFNVYSSWAYRRWCHSFSMTMEFRVHVVS